MQQHQQLMQMQPMMSYPINNITTDHIQQYLDENKSLILKIVDSQNSGKMVECAEHQAKLQRNLMYLAAIADSQPQALTLHSQYPQGGMMQQPGGQYMQHHQQALMAARSSMMYSQQQYASLQQHHAMHSQLGMSSSGLHMLQTDNSNAAGGLNDFSRKQDVAVSGGEGRGGGGSSGGDGGKTVYLKSPENSN